MSASEWRRAAARGITVVEMLITLGVIGLVLTLTVALFQLTTHHFSKTTTDLSGEQEARIAMSRVTKELRQAMPDPNLPPAPPVLAPMPSATATPYVQFTEAEPFSSADYRVVSYDTVTIFMSTPPPGHQYNDLIMKVASPNGPATSTVIGNDVVSFGVQAIYQDTLDITLTVSPPIRQDLTVKPYTLNTRVFVSYYKTNS
jgi:hypothetical protein